MALIVVIGIGAVLTLLVTASLSISLSGVVKAKTDQDWNAAVAAAYAGADDYKSKLANDSTYTKYGNPDSPFSASSKAAGTILLPPASATNPAFGLGQSGSWATMPGSGETASYRYEVDNSNYWSTGALRLQSTGRVGKQTRSIVVNLKQSGFINYLYFSNYEMPDPALTNNPATCVVKYRWQDRSDTCATVQFGAADTINGPLHSNDTILPCSATFNGPATTANPVGPPATPTRYAKVPGCLDPTFTVPGSPAYVPVIAMPPSNAQMKRETRTDLPAEVPRPGCLYTGPTDIVFNADGTMTVRSPWTKAIPSPSCGTPGDPTKNAADNIGKLAGAAGQKIAVPANNLIYVQNVPITPTSDPNYWPEGSTPPGLTCTGLSGSTGAGNGIGYPRADEYAPIAVSGTQAYGCRSGDAFVKGQLHGAVTVSAQNYLYVTGDITYVDSRADILGLVAEKAVWVWNPMSCSTKNGKSDCNSNCNGNCSCMGQGKGLGDGNSACNANYVPLLLDSGTGRTINAAILSVDHTFLVQNYDKGTPRGNLTVSGAIAQNFRGPVTATGAGSAPGSTGYIQKYTYDPRFRTMAPPKFLLPTSTTYIVSTQAEVRTAFTTDGSPG
ncbi:hypothetical protein [Pseudarthrobacter sp. H2]|uniref:hypothetical protein n=1 Tax=Pseudarthrobacter sp. H2 TaxID=3418415 RepID=UPI003CF6C6CA